MTMAKEFIERGALIARYDAEHVGPPGRARELMATAPAADVAPVVHGRWLNFYNDFTVAECDQCASQFEVSFDGEANGALWNGFKQFYKYCPNCGAKMDKEESRR